MQLAALVGFERMRELAEARSKSHLLQVVEGLLAKEQDAMPVPRALDLAEEGVVHGLREIHPEHLRADRRRQFSHAQPRARPRCRRPQVVRLLLLDRPLDHRPQFRRHLGLDAEPRLPGRTALIQEHSEAVNGAVAALSRRGEEWRLERDVDDVRYERGLWQLVQPDVECRLPDHAAAGGVDDHRRAVERVVALVPGQGLDRAAELPGDALGAVKRAVDEPDLLRAFLRESVADRARAAAGADHDDRPRVRPPAGLLVPDVVDEAVAIVVGAGERSVGSDDYAADRADALR